MSATAQHQRMLDQIGQAAVDLAVLSTARAKAAASAKDHKIYVDAFVAAADVVRRVILLSQWILSGAPAPRPAVPREAPPVPSGIAGPRRVERVERVETVEGVLDREFGPPRKCGDAAIDAAVAVLDARLATVAASAGYLPPAQGGAIFAHPPISRPPISIRKRPDG